MTRIIMLLTALTLTGAAAAAAGTASAASQAKVAFYSGFPSSGGSLVARMSVQAASQASAAPTLQAADAAVVTIGDHSYAFALAKLADGQAALAVKGEPAAKADAQAPLDAVVADLAKAQQGQESLVVVRRHQSGGQAVVALYHPQGGNAGLRVRAADRVTVWVAGQARDYAVSGSTEGGAVTGLEVKTGSGAKPLTDVVAALQTDAVVNAGGSGEGGSGAQAGSDAGAGVSVGSGAGVNLTVGGGG